MIELEQVDAVAERHIDDEHNMTFTVHVFPDHEVARGERMRSRRHQLKLTYADVSEFTGIKMTDVARVERGALRADEAQWEEVLAQCAANKAGCTQKRSPTKGEDDER